MARAVKDPMTNQLTPKFDANVLRFNQIVVVAGITVALLIQQPLIVVMIGVVLLAGSFNPRLAAFKRLYSSLIRPALRVAVNPSEDDPRPHNFAQGLGGVFLLVATLAFLGGWPLIGWSLAIVVVALALLNLTTNFCLGCFLYYQYRMHSRSLGRAP